MSIPYDENTYRAELKRVVDGDTLEIVADLGLRVKRNLYIRITNINAPELRRGTEEEKERGRAAKEYAKELFAKMVETGETVYVKFRKGKSFDRWLGRVYANLPDESVMDFGEEMVKAGHAEAVGDGW